MKDYEREKAVRVVLCPLESDEQFSKIATLQIEWPSSLTYPGVVVDCTQIENDYIYLYLVGKMEEVFPVLPVHVDNNSVRGGAHFRSVIGYWVIDIDVE